MLTAIRNLLLVVFLVPTMAYASEPDAPHTSAEWQIWAYSTAAPSFIGERATVLDQNNDVLREAVTAGRVCRVMPRCRELAGPMLIKPCQFARTRRRLRAMQAYLTETTPELNHDGFMWSAAWRCGGRQYDPHGDEQGRCACRSLDRVWTAPDADAQGSTNHCRSYQRLSYRFALPHVPRLPVRAFDDSGGGLLPILRITLGETVCFNCLRNTS